MATTQVKITHPTARTDESPATVAEIKHVLLETKPNAGTVWAPVGAPIPPGTTTRNVQNVPGGKWDYRASWVDTGDRVSAFATATVDIPIAALKAGTIEVTIV